MRQGWQPGDERFVRRILDSRSAGGAEMKIATILAAGL
jgi:hypothetical protein